MNTVNAQLYLWIEANRLCVRLKHGPVSGKQNETVLFTDIFGDIELLVLIKLSNES